MSPLVLSLFPGGGLLDHAFELEGFTVVRGPDPLWGGDVRTFHPPAGRFDGIIGGDPCQSHSSLANLVRAKGLEPSFPDLTGEYQRVVEEARPAWFLRENVPKAPDIQPAGYDVRSFLLDHSHLDSGDGTGHEQMRKRRFWFGVHIAPYGKTWFPCPCCDEHWCRLHWTHASICDCPPVDEPCPELRKWIDFALFELPDTVPSVIGLSRGQTNWNEPAYKARTQAVSGDPRAVAVAVGGSGKRKVTACAGGAGGGDPTNPKYRGIPNRSIPEMLRLQGLPEDWLKHQPWTMQAKRKIVGNGVPVPMGRALARAIRKALS